MFLTGIRGLVAQLEERGVCNAEAWGSNPHGSTGVRKFLDAPGLATDPGKGLRPRKTGAMIRCVEETQKEITRRFWTLHGFEETKMTFLRLSVDGSVRVPTKGVPSCDKLWVGAWSH